MEARRAGIDDPAEAISVAHRHLFAWHARSPSGRGSLVRLDVPYRVTDDVSATGDARSASGHRGRALPRRDPRLALRASGGALIAVMHAVLLGELGQRADSVHAEGVLRSFGLDPAEAAEIARRPLPDPIDPEDGRAQ